MTRSRLLGAAVFTLSFVAAALAFHPSDRSGQGRWLYA